MFTHLEIAIRTRASDSPLLLLGSGRSLLTACFRSACLDTRTFEFDVCASWVFHVQGECLDMPTAADRKFEGCLSKSIRDRIGKMAICA